MSPIGLGNMGKFQEHNNHVEQHTISINIRNIVWIPYITLSCLTEGHYIEVTIILIIMI